MWSFGVHDHRSLLLMEIVDASTEQPLASVCVSVFELLQHEADALVAGMTITSMLQGTGTSAEAGGLVGSAIRLLRAGCNSPYSRAQITADDAYSAHADGGYRYHDQVRADSDGTAATTATLAARRASLLTRTPHSV